MTKTKNYYLSKPDVDDFYDVNIQNNNMDIIDTELKKSAEHIANKNNPHGVTKSQLGLENVEVSGNLTGKNPTATDSTDAPAIKVRINGKTEQDGEPTPETPIDIVGVGENGSVEVKTTDNTYKPYVGETTANIPLTAPLYEGDYIEYRADGSGKLYRKMLKVTAKKSDFFIAGNNTYYYTPAIYPKDAYGTINNKTGFVYCNMTSDIQNPDPSGSENPDLKSGRAWVFTMGNASNAMLRISTNIYDALSDTQNIEFVYTLAEPIETDLTAEQIAEFEKLYTFEPVTNVFCEGEVDFMYYKDSDGGKAGAIVLEKADKALTRKNISQSNAITKTGEYALDAVEKNASVNGTMANQIAGLDTRIKVIERLNNTFTHLPRTNNGIIINGFDTPNYFAGVLGNEFLYKDGADDYFRNSLSLNIRGSKIGDADLEIIIPKIYIPYIEWDKVYTVKANVVRIDPTTKHITDVLRTDCGCTLLNEFTSADIEMRIVIKSDWTVKDNLVISLEVTATGYEV